MHNWKNIRKDQNGDAMVEAAILFPIIFMIFFALVILALYLPTRSALQYATQYTANALATGRSDTTYTYDGGKSFESHKNENVYIAFFGSVISGQSKKEETRIKADEMVRSLEGGTLTYRSGELTVQCYERNYVIYKEVVVTATRRIPSPINFSFIGFPEEIPITVSSTAVVKNGDEFVRNVDLASDILDQAIEALGINFDGLNELLNKFFDFMGI